MTEGKVTDVTKDCIIVKFHGIKGTKRYSQGEERKDVRVGDLILFKEESSHTPVWIGPVEMNDAEDGIIHRKVARILPNGLVMLKNSCGVEYPVVNFSPFKIESGSNVIVRRYVSDSHNMASYAAVIGFEDKNVRLDRKAVDTYFDYIKEKPMKIAKTYLARVTYAASQSQDKGFDSVILTDYKGITEATVKIPYSVPKVSVGDIVALRDTRKGWKLVASTALEGSDEILKKNVQYWENSANYWEKKFIEIDAESSYVSTTAPRGERSRFMKFFSKSGIIILTIGLLAGHIPFMDIADRAREFFAGSNNIVTGQYEEVSICNGCGKNFWDITVALCGECGSQDIAIKVAAPLSRERTFPLRDKLVGFRLQDGTIVLNDGDTIIASMNEL